MMTEISKIFNLLMKNRERLTDSQMKFLQSLKKHYARNKTLSEKQYKILMEFNSLSTSVTAKDNANRSVN